MKTIVALSTLKRKRRKEPSHLREWEPASDREILMAKMARRLGRGQDVIYHGTRHPAAVLRYGRLKLSNDGNVYFTRSPEQAAHSAYLRGREIDGYVPAILVLNKRTLSYRYSLRPSREEEWPDEREESIIGREVSFRRHLIGVVRDDDVAKFLGARQFRYVDEIDALPKRARTSYLRQRRNDLDDALERRKTVRDLIVRERRNRLRSRP